MLTVKKLADLLGLSPEVIRHYTHMGILKPIVNSGNNYKYYDEQDLLYLANIRVNRSLGLSLPQAQDFQSGSVKEQRHLLTERSRQLCAEIEKLQKLQKRLTEVENFLAQAEMCRKEGVVKDVRRDPIHSVYTFGLKKSHTDRFAIVQQWSKLFPFVHFSVKIPKEELNDPNFGGPYSVELGLGIVHKYLEEFHLQSTPPVETIPEGRFLIIYLKTYDILNLGPKDLKPLLDKVLSLNMSFTHSSSGRLLAIEETPDGPLFSILIRVRISD